jgi:hypothetical protein
MRIYILVTQVIISLFDKCVNEITLWSCETVPLTEIGPPHPPGGENRPIVANFQVSPAPLRQSLTGTKRGMYVLFTAILSSVYGLYCNEQSLPAFFSAFRALHVALEEDLTVYCRQNWHPLPIPPQLVQQQWLPLFPGYEPLFSLCGR